MRLQCANSPSRPFIGLPPFSIALSTRILYISVKGYSNSKLIDCCVLLPPACCSVAGKDHKPRGEGKRRLPGRRFGGEGLAANECNADAAVAVAPCLLLLLVAGVMAFLFRCADQVVERVRACVPDYAWPRVLSRLARASSGLCPWKC